ncbi:MAG: NADP-dependent oxidoreductase [Pseudomonadota bacterium]
MQTFADLATDLKVDDHGIQKWTVARRPDGNVRPDDFAWHESEIPELQPNQVLLKTHYLSLAPVMRGYMSGQSFAGETALDIGDVIHGRGVAQVVRSRHPDWHEGQVVQGQLGWQTYKVSGMTPDEKFRAMPPNGLSASLGLGALGMTGLSAWAGYFNVGEPKSGETVLVSGAVGGVGSLVIQFASQISGGDVVGIAGGPEKCALAKQLGCARTIDYKSEDIATSIAASLPSGLDLYFDNVGGEILDAAMDHLSLGARIVLCGSISEYTRERAYPLPNYARLRRTDSQMRGFFVYNHLADWDRAMDEIAGWIQDGRVSPVEQITDGFEHMPAALAGLYTGQNAGKQLCRVRGEPMDWI